MIKTLRITSVIAAILAGVFFVFPVVYGVRSDERVDEFLKQPSVKEKFENAADNKAKAVQSRTSPLVEQAEAFAAYLNPAKPTTQRPSVTAKTTIDSKLAVTPKFRVFATSVCPKNPELSLALIDEPGRGRYWVRQSGKVGHLLVEQVKDGAVVIKGSEETFELKIPDKAEMTSLRTLPGSPLRRGPSLPASKSPVPGRTSTGVRGRTSTPQTLPRSGVNDERMGQLVNKLKDLQKDSGSYETDSKLSKEERAARIEELISKFKATRVSAEESKKLGNMGEKLNDKDASGGEENEGKVEADTSEPDTSPEE
jgi:hypothetical protein